MLRFALRMLLRDWRAGELRVLALGLVLAAGGVTSVAFFADRVRQALTREAHQVLGADVLMTADHAWSPEFRDEIIRLGLARAESVSFVSMARAGKEALLTAVKAVTPSYPLRGKLRIAPGLNAADAEIDAVPPRGTVWLDERMTAALNVRPGGAVELGRARFRVGAVLTLEPDRGVSFMNFAPRLMMRLDDLPATGLVQPGSRISYQQLAAGDRERVEQFEQWARARLGRGEHIDSLENARPEVRAGLDRAQSFLGLTAMLAVILSAVAVALGTRRYTRRHLDGYAVMRCLGAAQSQLFALFSREFLLLAFGAFAAIGYGALKLIGRFGRTGSVSWRYGLANLLRRPRANAVQITAIAVGLTAILLLVRADLLDTWRKRLPPDAPDRFLVNIQPEQRQALSEFLERNGVKRPQTFPMVRARLVAINGKQVSAEDYSHERARRKIEREFNVKYLPALQLENKVSAGAWFSPDDLERGTISVEHWIAERFGIRTGDRLDFVSAGQGFSAPVTSIRKLDWDSMRPNFFFITTPALLEGYAASYIASFHAPPGDALLTLRLLQAFPNVTVIDVGVILRQVQIVMDQLIGAVQLVFLFALAAGVLVLYAALLATQDERTHEAAVMRALGASRSQVLAAQRSEFAVLGAIAGLLGSAGATAIGWTLATRVFQLDFVWNGWVWLAGPALGLACVVLNAWAGARAALSRPPMAALRAAQ